MTSNEMKENPNGFLERIETIPTDKEHLSQDEVIRLASTPCSAPALKRAFLFSSLTALRKSDIKKLTWEEPYNLQIVGKAKEFMNDYFHHKHDGWQKFPTASTASR